MNFKELCEQRYSVRSYKPEAIPQEKLNYIMECVRLAPSAVNKQPWHFTIYTNETDKQKIQQCYGREWIQEAPAYIVAYDLTDEAWTRRYDEKNHADIDVTIAIEHLCLAAAEQGLGTCWVCNFDTALCRELLDLPSYVEPIVLLPIGYPAADVVPLPKKRKLLDEIVEWR